MNRTVTEFVVGPADLAAALARVGDEDAVSLPLLAEPFRRALAGEAARASYRPSRRVIGSGDTIVRQEMDCCARFPADSLFHVLRDRFEALMTAAIDRLPASPLATPLALDDYILQRYRPGPVGITPHRDHVQYVNIACLFTLAGEARFALCDDRGGAGARDVDAAPGRVILLRAPGFGGADRRPFHFVADIRTPRLSFGLRQLRDEQSAHASV